MGFTITGRGGGAGRSGEGGEVSWATGARLLGVLCPTTFLLALTALHTFGVPEDHGNRVYPFRYGYRLTDRTTARMDLKDLARRNRRRYSFFHDLPLDAPHFPSRLRSRKAGLCFRARTLVVPPA